MVDGVRARPNFHEFSASHHIHQMCNDVQDFSVYCCHFSFRNPFFYVDSWHELWLKSETNYHSARFPMTVFSATFWTVDFCLAFFVGYYVAGSLVPGHGSESSFVNVAHSLSLIN